MSLLRPVYVPEWLFLLSIGWLTLGTLAARYDRDTAARFATTYGWGFFVVFWAVKTADYLGRSRYFLGAVSLLTLAVAAYAGVLSYRQRPAGRRLATAFVAMSVVFVPYQFILPVYRVVLETTTRLTAVFLTRLGYANTTAIGSDGYLSIIHIEAVDVTFHVVSACTGLSAIALFAGTIAVSRESLTRRIAAILVTGPLIYAMNIYRMVFVASAIPSERFAATAPLVTSLFGVTDPPLVSFYFAEALLSQTTVVLALASLYYVLTMWFPDLDTMLREFVDACSRDLKRTSARLHRYR